MFRQFRTAWLLPLFLFALIAAPVSSAFAAGPAGWITFRSTEGRMSILLPTEPQTSEEPLPDGPGAPGRLVMYQAVKGNQLYLSGFVDYSPDFPLDVDGELRANRDNFVSGIKGSLITSNPIMNGSSKGLEFTAESPAGQFAKGRFFVVGQRVYMALAAVPTSERQSGNIDPFLQSLTFRQ